MKVFLCGGGSGKMIKEATIEFGKLLDKNKPLLYIPLAINSDRYDECFKWIKKEMSLISLKKIEMLTNSYEIKTKNLNDYCAIYIGGGNTYKLLKELKNSGAFDIIKQYLENDGIVFGGSAGAIIFGKDIDSCLMQDENYVDLKDTTGFNIISGYSLLCHLNLNDRADFNRDKNLNYLKNYSKKNKTIYLSEDDTIFVTNNGITIIGNSDYIVYKNGLYQYVKPDSFMLK